MNASGTSSHPDDRRALFYRLSQTFSSSLDLDEVLNLVIDEVISLTGAERGLIALIENGGKLVFQGARGIDRKTISQPEFQVSLGVVERVGKEGHAILTSDAQSDDYLGMRKSVAGLGLRSIMCVPLQIKGATIGLIYIDSRIQAGIFTQDDLDLLAAIASISAIAIDNARLYRLAIEKGRLDQELEVALKIQEGLLPKQTPQIPGWQLSVWWQPARHVSGDFYDFIPLGEDKLGLLVGDVTGKGLPAALIMANACALLRIAARKWVSPQPVLAQVNKLLCMDIPKNMFVTCFYALLDTRDGNLRFANAGHTLPYHLKPDGLLRLTATGMPLGLMTELPYEEKETVLARDDRVVFLSDGVVEAHNRAREMFGSTKLKESLAGLPRDGSLIEHLRNALGEFAGLRWEREDDVTVLELRRVA